jgi:hypothetical protein
VAARPGLDPAAHLAHLAHLARRFVGSLWPVGPSQADVAWVRAQLLPGEWVLWRRMPAADRRHSAGVARDVAADLGPAASRPVLAAALLHDVGKLESGLGTVSRVAATVAGLGLGHDPVAVARWADAGGARGRVGRYLQHPERGAALLEAAGSDELTVAWAREHHRPPSGWTVPEPLAQALKAADDD